MITEHRHESPGHVGSKLRREADVERRVPNEEQSPGIFRSFDKKTLITSLACLTGSNTSSLEGGISLAKDTPQSAEPLVLDIAQDSEF